MAQMPPVDQAIEGHHNVQLGVVHGNVHITQVVHLTLPELYLLHHLQAGVSSAAQQAQPSHPAPPAQPQAQEQEVPSPQLERIRAMLSEASARRLALYGGRRLRRSS